MGKPTDRDGKSKTASAVDARHYPEQNEVDGGSKSIQDLDETDIGKRAHELWESRGCRQGFAEQDWFDACEELRAKNNTRNTRKYPEQSGSVQH